MEGFDTPKNLKKWLVKMGYRGNTPPYLKPLCNPCTALIWEQLIHAVKPKQEVQHIRNNILINRLTRNNESCSSPSISLLKHESRYPRKEIETWNRKQNLQKQLNAVLENINEAEIKLNSLSNNNKMKYLRVQNNRLKIQRNQESTFLLEAKLLKLEAEIADVEEMLILARNLTPVESEEQNKTEVLEMLKMCSQKLEKIIDKQNETEASPPVTAIESILEPKTPFSKISRRPRGFTSLKKKTNVFTSTKISFQSKKKPKGLDDSLGLLDDSNMTFDNALAASSFKDANFSNIGARYDVAILNDQNLHELIEETLYKNSRLIIWNTLLGMSELSKMHLFDAIVDNDKKNFSLTSSQKKDTVLMRLYATHVDYELKTIKVELSIQELKQKLNQMQDAAFSTLAISNMSSSRITELKDHLRLQQKDAGLVAAIQYLHKAVRNLRESTEKKDDLRMIREKAQNLEENIVLKLTCIEHKLAAFKQFHDLMMQARNETCILVRKLAQFTLDNNWTLPLSANLSSVEIGTFLHYPLEYNQTMTLGNTKTFLRDLPINYIPYQENFDSNFIHMLVTLLQNPCSPAETLLVDIIKAKLKMDQLKALQYVPSKYKTHGYTLEELQSQESYIDYALDKLKSSIYATSNNKVMHISTNMREVMNLWLEMPIRNFVSPKRLFNSAPYSYYEKQFENFYKQL